MAKPLLLDLFCGAGGAAMGYYRAGFDVVGIDIKPQPHYPFTFIQGDALNPPVKLGKFDAIHASPPCQGYSVMKVLRNAKAHPDLVAVVRSQLKQTGLPWVIENVVGAPLRTVIQLCGSMFDLRSSQERYLQHIPRHDVRAILAAFARYIGDVVEKSNAEGNSTDAEPDN